MEKNQRNLKLGAIMSYVWVLVHIFVSFVFAPLMIQSLGKSEYGLYQVVASFLSYISVLESSLSSGVLRFYCNSLAKGDERLTENTLAICRSIYRKLTYIVLLIGAGIIVAFRLFYRASFSESEIREGTLMLGLLVINLGITLTNALYLACMRGQERFVAEKGLSCIAQLLQLLLCFLFLSHFHYAAVVTAIQVVINAAVSLIRYQYVKRTLHVRVVLHQRDKKLERSILIFSSGILFSLIADQIFWKTDQVILGKMYNTSVVAVYAIGAQIYTNYMYAGTTVASVFFPRVSGLFQEENGLWKISTLFVRVGRIAFLLCFMVLSGFVIFGREFLFLWVGEDYLPAYPMAIVVMIPFTIDVIQHLGLTILQVMDKYAFRSKMYFAAALLNVITTVILARYFAGLGAALSTGVSMFITSGILMNVYYLKAIRLDIKAFWKNIGGMLVKLLIPAGVLYAVNLWLPFPYGILSFSGKLLVFVIVYAAFAYMAVMNLDEKSMVKKAVAKILGGKRVGSREGGEK